MAQTETRTRTEGIHLPPAGTWTFDKAHTSIGFVARHMITKVRGRFSDYDGVVRIAERPEDSSVELTIRAASIDTGTEGRDGHLKSDDFLAVEEYPELTFTSREVRPLGGSRFRLVGDLTIRDVTNEVALEAEFHGWGPGMTPEAPPVAAFSARAEIDREDWDLTWNMAVETGGFLVGRRVAIEIEAELNPAA